MSDFLVRDLWLAAWLTFKLKTKPTLIRQSADVVVFAFPAGEAVYEEVNRFNAGDFIPGVAYASVVKALRADMYRCRDSCTVKGEH